MTKEELIELAYKNTKHLQAKVHTAKEKEADDIIQDGVEAQVEYLLTCYSPMMLAVWLGR